MSMRILFIIILLAVAGGVIYYTGVYTYFLEKEVREAIPIISNSINSTVTLKSGEFQNVDSIHKGKGQAKIIALADGKKILRLENFEITNGPDLYVQLWKSADPSQDSRGLEESIDVGKLKGNIGEQNYEIPTDIRIGDYNSVVIWCKRFGVLFSFASLN